MRPLQSDEIGVKNSSISNLKQFNTLTLLNNSSTNDNWLQHVQKDS